MISDEIQPMQCPLCGRLLTASDFVSSRCASKEHLFLLSFDGNVEKRALCPRCDAIKQSRPTTQGSDIAVGLASLAEPFGSVSGPDNFTVESDNVNVYYVNALHGLTVAVGEFNKHGISIVAFCDPFRSSTISSIMSKMLEAQSKNFKVQVTVNVTAKKFCRSNLMEFFVNALHRMDGNRSSTMTKVTQDFIVDDCVKVSEPNGRANKQYSSVTSIREDNVNYITRMLPVLDDDTVETIASSIRVIAETK